METDGEIGLGQAQMLLGFQKQEGQVVDKIISLLILAAGDDVEADGKTREEFGAVGISQVDDLVEFQPQALDDLKRFFLIQRPGLNISIIIRLQVTVHPAR